MHKIELIAHRKNTIEDLKQTEPCYGIEMDIRSNNGELVVHHDPFAQGCLFKDWLKHYQHQTLILNVKEEGLEQAVLELVQKHKVEKYFFLDQSFPFLVKWANKGEKNLAVRLSEYESIETVLTLAGKVKWVWVDCFTRFPLSNDSAQKLKAAGFSLCLVSPELQGRDSATEIPSLHRLLTKDAIEFNAICTKQPKLWEQCLNAPL